MKPWNKLTDKAKVRRLQKEKRALEALVDSLRSQVIRAAGATNEMARLCRSLEVKSHALNVSNRGISVFTEGNAPRLAMGISIPELAPSTRAIVDNLTLEASNIT